MARVDRQCAECGSLETRKDKLRQIYLCQICFESDKYKLVYKTYVKQKYFVDVAELEGCEHFKTQFKRFPERTLYKLSDVLRVFCVKYGINPDDFDAINQKLNYLREYHAKIKDERKRNKQIKQTSLREQRKAALIKQLTLYGLELREDSKLCQGYIEGTIKDWTVSNIVHRMCQMKYLYEYCHMDECYEEAERDQQEELDAGYFPDCSTFELAELIALNRYGGYPARWPWLTTLNIIN